MRRFAAALLLLSACPSDPPTIDPSPLCAEFASPVATLSTFPATYRGDWGGAGADLEVAAGMCPQGSDFELTAGDDVVVALENLVPGQRYATRTRAGGLTVAAATYVADGCVASPPIPGTLQGCRAFAEYGGLNAFVAPDSGRTFVVVDQAAEHAAGVSSPFQLDVYAVECDGDSACAAPTPHCVDQRCVACVDSSECTDPAAPACELGSCVSLDRCTGDDAGEPGNDTPAGAPVLTPTASTPARLELAICSDPAAEIDHVIVRLDEPAALRAEVTWADGSSFSVWFRQGNGFIGGAQQSPSRLSTEVLPAGDYELQVSKYDPAGVAASTPYTLTVATADCVTDLDCPVAAPQCDIGACVAGPACTGDDAAEPGDDGPSGATSLTPAPGGTRSHTGAICGLAGERDWIRLDALAGDGFTVELAWADATRDLDLLVLDGAFDRFVGMDLHRRPSRVQLSFLPAGSYWVRVDEPGGAPATTPYTLTVQRSAGACAGDIDCADDFSTQLHRAHCNPRSGACERVNGQGALPLGLACDDNDDCLSGICANELFSAHAERNVCTRFCATTADCAPLGADLRCTTQFGNDYCRAACTTDLDCGTFPFYPDVDPGQPWDYYTCDVATGVCGP